MKKKNLTGDKTCALFADAAAKEAKRICGDGSCPAGYDCGHENKIPHPMRMRGQGAVCPLSRYGIEPDKRTFREKLEAEERIPSPEEELNGLFALCACCGHADVMEQGTSYELSITEENRHAFCVDCPVRMARDGIEENLAEASMS